MAFTPASMAASARTTIPAKVAENRRRMAEQIGVAPEHFLTVFQIHSPDVAVASAPWDRSRAPARRRHRHPHRRPRHRRHRRRLRTDPVCRSERARDRRRACRLEGRADRHCGIHRRGDGRSSARSAADIVAAIGPLIRQHSYEVGNEFVERFLRRDAENALFFLPAAREGHAMFDLAGFIRKRLENAGVLVDRRHRRRHLFR